MSTNRIVFEEKILRGLVPLQDGSWVTIDEAIENEKKLAGHLFIDDMELNLKSEDLVEFKMFKGESIIENSESLENTDCGEKIVQMEKPENSPLVIFDESESLVNSDTIEKPSANKAGNSLITKSVNDFDMHETKILIMEPYLFKKKASVSHDGGNSIKGVAEDFIDVFDALIDKSDAKKVEKKGFENFEQVDVYSDSSEELVKKDSSSFLDTAISSECDTWDGALVADRKKILIPIIVAIIGLLGTIAYIAVK